jgi:hypothetical protein
MRKLIFLLMLVSTLTLTACVPMAAQRHTWENPDGRNRAQDDLECRALAAQAAQGAGGWSSDRTLRAVLYDQTVQQYYNQCAESRGYIPTR